MANVTVYFATNRVPQGATTDWHSYRADILPPTDPSQIIYAEAFVQGTELSVEGSGTIAAISHPQTGGFATGVVQDIVGSGKNILIFIHGLRQFIPEFDRPRGLQPRMVRRLWRKRRRHHRHRVQLAVLGPAVRRATAPSPR